MKNQKYSAVAGIALFVLAALFSISLLLVAFDFGGINPAKNSFFYSLGKMFTGVYGLCSICIPAFLIAAGIQCFNAKWRLRNGVLLLGSIIPFFTLDAIEHICRMILASDSDSIMLVKLSSTLLIGALILAAEYLLLSILGDILENSLASNKDIDIDDEEILDETEPDDDDEIQLFESEKETEEANDEDKIDLAHDKIFLQQKELLKDLINDGKEKVEEEDENIEDENATIADDPTIIENDTLIADEPLPEKIEESLPEPPKEESPFEHIFDSQEKAHEEELQKNEEVALPPAEITFEDSEPKSSFIATEEETSEEKTEIALSEPNEAEADKESQESLSSEPEAEFTEEEFTEEEFTEPETSSIESVEPEFEEEFEEEEVPVNTEDFQTDFDDMSDVQPVEFNQEEESFEDFSETLAPEESFEEPEDFSNDTEDDFSEPVIEDESFDEAESTVQEEESFDEPETGFENDNLLEEAEPIAETEEVFNEPEPNFENEETFEEPEPTFESEDGVEEAEALDVEENNELTEEENPADFINIEDISDNDEDDIFSGDDDDESLGVEDIFSQMEADAAANPVFKNPEELPARDSLYQNTSSENTQIEAEETKTTRKLSEYKIPTDLLEKFENDEYWRIDDETKAAGQNLKQTLNEFGIEAEVTGIRKGPVVTMFELLPAPGVKLSKIVNLQDNIALALAAKSVRIVAPIPGKHAVGIEIPNKERAIVSFREIIEQPLPEYKKMAIPVILGKDISGQSQIIDIAKTPHLLIAGATGAGKSVCVNSIILSILYNRSPNDVKLIMVDPKVVELKLYNDIPHLLTPVVTEPKKALQVLQYCICEMERRYALLDGMGVRDIVSYNTRIRERHIATEKLPYIVVIIDEFADLMATSGKELETSVARLTAMSRAVGIHLVLATQRPSVNVITGLIKANIPSRIAFMVASRTDSNIIIDSTGAEKLLGKGDMLYTSAVNPIPTRIQGTLVSDNEVENVVDYVKSFGGPDYIDDEIFVDDDEEEDNESGIFSDGEDPLYDQALQIVVQTGKASASYLQRRLKIGYNRAARLVEDMEERGIVGPANGSKPREVIHVP